MNERLASYFALTKPGVVILLQITGICSVIAHDLLEAGGLSGSTARTIAVVLVGGYLTAGGANSINMWYDRGIAPLMALIGPYLLVKYSPCLLSFLES